MHQLICHSPKQSLILKKKKFKEELTPESKGIKLLYLTRWTVHTGAIQTVLDNYMVLQKAFQEMNNSSHDDYGRRAGGVCS